jgi:hypothetical protein
VLCIAAFLLVGCDPVSVPGPSQTAEIDVRLHTSGNATIQLLVGGRRSRDELRSLGRQVLPTILPAASAHEPKIDSNLGAPPFVTMTVGHAYRPGRRPSIRIDTRRAVDTLAQNGVTTVRVNVSIPNVSASSRWTVNPDDTSRNSWAWTRPVHIGSAPAGTITLHPVTSRAWMQLVLLGVSLVGILTSLAFIWVRRRTAAIVAGVLATLIAAAVIPATGVAQMDNLGVAGDLRGLPLQILHWLPLVTILLVFDGVTLVVFAAVHPRSRPL